MPTSNRIIIINGIEGAGVSTVDRLGSYLEHDGYTIIDVELVVTSWYNGRSIRIRNENLKRIRAVARPGDHVIAHSNGSRLCYNLMDGGTKFGHVFLFAPALDSGTTLRKSAYESVTVICNPHDTAILAGSILPGSKWGMMGRRGYTGVSDAVRTLYRPYRRGLGHSHYFVEPHLSDSAEIVKNTLEMKYISTQKFIEK